MYNINLKADKICKEIENVISFEEIAKECKQKACSEALSFHLIYAGTYFDMPSLLEDKIYKKIKIDGYIEEYPEINKETLKTKVLDAIFHKVLMKVHTAECEDPNHKYHPKLSTTCLIDEFGPTVIIRNNKAPICCNIL